MRQPGAQERHALTQATTSTQLRIEELRKRRARNELGGGQERIDAQHARNKLTAHERLRVLLDPGSFQELDPFVVHRSNDFGLERQRIPGDGVVTGFGRINGRLVFVYAQDFTVIGGSLGEMHAAKITKIMDMALKNGAPIVGLSDGGGARIQEGVAALAGYSEIFLRNTLASGVVPQLSAIMGPARGGAACPPAPTDFCVMVRETSHMFITGPNIIKAVTHEDVTFEELGGAMVHSSRSGVAHFAAENDEEALYLVRRLLSYLPQNNLEDAPFEANDDDPTRRDLSLNDIVPDNPNRPYDMRRVIEAVFDEGSFFEVHEHFAQNIIVGFARLAGRS